MRKKSGFTLIELLVVIAIIGMLSSIVLAVLNSARVKGRDARRLSDMNQIQKALELYYNDNKEYPMTLASLAPTFMPVVPQDPTFPTRGYRYVPLKSSSTATLCSTYHLGALMENEDIAQLTGDADAVALANSLRCDSANTDFSGLNRSTNQFTIDGTANVLACGGAVGTAQPGGTEACYDIKP